MVTIPLKAHLAADGTLNLQVRTGLPESDVDVVVMVEPAGKPANRWPMGFIDETYGAFAASPLERPDQNGPENREPIE